jgi:hypothetical protein
MSTKLLIANRGDSDRAAVASNRTAGGLAAGI